MAMMIIRTKVPIEKPIDDDDDDERLASILLLRRIQEGFMCREPRLVLFDDVLIWCLSACMCTSRVMSCWLASCP